MPLAPRGEKNEIVYIPLEELTKPPPGIIEHFVDHWWCYVEGKGVVVVESNKTKYRVAMCNRHENIAKRFAPTYGAVPMQISSAFVKVNIADYC